MWDKESSCPTNKSVDFRQKMPRGRFFWVFGICREEPHHSPFRKEEETADLTDQNGFARIVDPS
jgi:hypothetical protein